MRRVWIFNHYAQHPGESGGTRHHSIARLLRSAGWDATLISASFDHFARRQRLSSGEKIRRASHYGVEFLWLHTGSYRGNGAMRIGGMVEYYLRARGSSIGACLDRPAAVVGSSVHPLAALAALEWSRRLDVPFIFEVRDLWPETLIAFGCLRERSLTARAMRALEKHLYRNASRVITLLPGAGEYIASLGIDRSKVVYIPNGSDSIEAIPLRRHTGGGFLLRYVGSLGDANAVDIVLRAVTYAQATNPGIDLRLEIIGAGPARRALEALASSLDPARIRFFGPVAKSDVLGLLAGADGLVMAVHDHPRLYRFGISMNKVYEYLASSRPVVISASACNDPVTESGAGFSVPAGDYRALGDAIARLALLPADTRVRMGERGASWVRANHSFQVLTDRFAATLDAAVAAHSSSGVTPGARSP